MIWSGIALSRWRLARNALRARGPGRSHPLLGVTLAVLLALLVGKALETAFAASAEAGFTAAQAGAMLGLLLTGLITGLLVFDLHEAVSTLVADSDLELLRRAPLPARVLFAIKLADALPRTLLLIVVIGIPAVVAFHMHHPLPAWGWALVALQLGALWAIPLGLGAAAAIRLLCMVPAQRARDVLGLLSALTFLALWLLNSFAVPQLAATADGVGLGEWLARPNLVLRLSPGHWAGRSIAAAAAGAWFDALVPTGLLVLAGAAALALAAWTASGLLERAQTRVFTGAHRVAKRSRMIGGGFFRAVIARDTLLVLRDWSVLGDVLTGAVLWSLLPLIGAPIFDASVAFFGQAMLIVLTVALGYEIAARLIPLERHGLAWTKLAPVPAVRWIAAKVASGALLSLPLVALACATLVALQLRPSAIFAALTIALPALALSLSVGVWTGAAFGRADWKNPRAMLSLTGRLAAMGLLLLQAALWLAVLAASEAPIGGLRLPGWTPLAIAAVLATPALWAAAASLERREHAAV